MKSLLAKSFPNIGLFILRVGLGSLMFLHGYPKLMGGPEGWEKLGGVMSLLGVSAMPAFWGFMAAFAESVGAGLLILGLFTRPSALMLAFTMFVATFMHHTNGDDFMRVTSRPLELMFVFLGLVFIGAGKWSFDHILFKKKKD